MSGLYTCRPDPDDPHYYEIIAPDGSVIDRLKDFHEVEKALNHLNHIKKSNKKPE